MKGRYADLHVHSTHSDSSLSPAEIVRDAVQNHVGLIAVIDHEVYSGSREAEPLALAAGIGFLRGLETECYEDGQFYHLLAYGVDFDEPVFRQLIEENRKKLDDMSVDLIEQMMPLYPQLSLEDYEAFERTASMGGWKGLEYLYKKGATGSIREGIPLYAQFGVRYEDAGFPSLLTSLDAIHGAGGAAVLAHPGVTLGARSPDAFKALVSHLLDQGVDGIECFYPRHSTEITETCLGLCRTRNLIITAGSDCHGTFGRTRVGEMDVPIESLSLKELLP